MRAKKSFFTLLEIIVVLFIISFGAILTGVKINELYREQRFLSETQQVLSRLSMAQDLMLILDTDVLVNVARNPEGKIQVWLEVEKPFEDPWTRIIEKKLTLDAIKSYKFKGDVDQKLPLLFSLGNMSPGTLSLFEDKRQFHIELAGYPALIKGTTEKIKEPIGREKSQRDKSKVLYPKEVYEKLYAKEKNKI